MKLRFEEQLVIFISILKWVLLSAIIGVIAGFSSSIFITIVHWVTSHSMASKYSFYFLPLALFATAWISEVFVHNDLGTDKIIESINKSFGKIKSDSIPYKIISVLIILGAGGSAGKESPCAQLGAGLSSTLADIFRVDDRDRKKMVICGFSAGFATVFGAPIAGALFGIEVLFVGAIMYDVLLPSFISSIVAYHISSGLGITYFRTPLTFVPVFTNNFIITVVVFGIFIGICSYLFIELIRLGHRITSDFDMDATYVGFIGGIVLIILTLLSSRDYLGLGLNVIESSLKGDKTVWYAFMVKALFTSITLSSTRSGSLITPIFFIGATAGNAFSQLFHVDIATFSAIGFVSLLAGTTNTPIACSIMAVEMFGADIAPYASIACVLSFLMTGHRSLYSSQVLTLAKSRSVVIETGKEIQDARIQIVLRQKSWQARIISIWETLKHILKKL